MYSNYRRYTSFGNIIGLYHTSCPSTTEWTRIFPLTVVTRDFPVCILPQRLPYIALPSCVPYSPVCSAFLDLLNPPLRQLMGSQRAYLGILKSEDTTSVPSAPVEHGCSLYLCVPRSTQHEGTRRIFGGMAYICWKQKKPL